MKMTTIQINAITRHIQNRYRALADPTKATAMQGYMKTDMPFHGIQKPQRMIILRELNTQFPIETQKHYRAVIEALWALPHREEKYMALHIAQHYKQFNTPAQLPLWKRLIRSGAWWDFVDDISIRLVGSLLLEHRKQIKPMMEQWIDADDMWVRRGALIVHIKHKQQTDHKQLFDFCKRRAHETEFFIRKAIGWTLREYAKTNPAAVKRFTLQHRTQLSPLSFREATRHLHVPPA